MSEFNPSWEELGKEFQLSLKDFVIISDKLSKKSLHRVINALAAHPLEDDLITLVHPEEEVLYKIGINIQSIKLNMMVESNRLDMEKERIEQAQTDRASEAKEE